MSAPEPAPPPSPDLDGFTASNNKYELLGVASDAPPEVIKRAYRKAAFLYHPDRHPVEHKQQAEEIFKRITRAYATLLDPALRQRYDEMLRRGMEDAEVDGHAADEGVSLSQILANIYEYEHVFAESDMKLLADDLYAFVLRNLIAEVHEEVVAVVPIQGVPTNTGHQGKFQTGAMVFTTVRVMIPFRTGWEETRGNVKTVYKQAYMPTFAFPGLTNVAIISAGRMKPRVHVAFQAGQRYTEVRSKKANLAKLLLLCNIWGVPVEGRESPDRGREWRRVLLWYPLWTSLATWLTYGWFFSQGDETWEAVLFAFSLMFAIGFARAWKAARGATIQDLIRERQQRPVPGIGARAGAESGA